MGGEHTPAISVQKRAPYEDLQPFLPPDEVTSRAYPWGISAKQLADINPHEDTVSALPSLICNHPLHLSTSNRWYCCLALRWFKVLVSALVRETFQAWLDVYPPTDTLLLGGTHMTHMTYVIADNITKVLRVPVSFFGGNDVKVRSKTCGSLWCISEGHGG